MNPWRLRATLVGQGRLQIARRGRQRRHQRDLVDALRSDLVADLHRRGVGVICALIGYGGDIETRTLAAP